MPNFPQNKNFRERPECAVFLHGFNTNVSNWDTYREQCYQELKNKYRVYISKFDIGRFSESAYVHLKSPQDVQKLRDIDKYKDPKTGEMISRIKLAGGNVIVYPYCKNRNPNAKERGRKDKERSESVSSYRSDRSSVRSGRSRASNQSSSNNAWNNNRNSSNNNNNYRRSNNRNISRDSSIASNRSSPISVNDAISSRRSHNQSSYSSQVVTDWSETEDNDYDENYNSNNNSPLRQNTITEKIQNLTLSENSQQNIIEVKPVDSSITVKASESVVELNREDTVRPVHTQETVVPGSSQDNKNEEDDLIIPNLSDAASVHSDYLLPEHDQQEILNEETNNYNNNNINFTNYQSTSRSRAASIAAQSGYCTENEEDLEDDEITFEKRFQNELKHNLPDVFWQLDVKENYISTLRNVYRNSKSEFLQTIIQYSKELNELHERILQKHQQEQLLAQQMAQQVYNQAQQASLQNIVNQNLSSLNDNDMSSLLHYWSNNNNNQNQQQFFDSAPIQRTSNMPSTSSDFGTNSTPQTPIDNPMQNGIVDPNFQNNLAAAQMVSQVYNNNINSSYSSPINFPKMQRNLEFSPETSQPNATVYNITNNYNNFANVNGAGGYEQNQMVKQPSA